MAVATGVVEIVAAGTGIAAGIAIATAAAPPEASMSAAAQVMVADAGNRHR